MSNDAYSHLREEDMGGDSSLFGESSVAKESKRERRRLEREAEAAEKEEERKKREEQERALRTAGRGSGGRLAGRSDDGLSNRLG